MTGVEYGDEGVKSPFPKEWGRPVGDAYSEERALWVKRKVREHLAGASMRQLRMRQLQMLLHLRQRLYEGEDNA
jgi:hypothetical protein